MTFSIIGRKSLLVAAVVVAAGILMLLLRNGEKGDGEAGLEGSVGKVPSREWTGGSTGGGDVAYSGSLRVEAVLSDESLSDGEVRDALFVIAKDGLASVDERSEALGHGLILSPDEDLGLLEDVISEVAWPNALLVDFLDDAMTRPDPGRLRLLVEILIRAKPPLRSEVEETLGFLLDQDFGGDFEAWREAADSWSENDSE